MNILWQLHGHGEEVHVSGHPYWWINDQRREMDNVNIQYTLSGTLRFIENSNKHLVPKGSFLLHDHNDGTEYGVYDRDNTYVCLWVAFRGAGFKEHWDMLREKFGSVITDADGHVLQLMRDIIRTGSPTGEQDVTRAATAVHQFVMRLTRQMDRQRDRWQKPVERALMRLRANPLFPWSIKELVDEEGCSREYFTRVFQERYESSPAHWLSQQRSQHAVLLLKNTKLTVEDIAQQSGFPSAHNLARTLRRLYDRSPRAIRG